MTIIITIIAIVVLFFLLAAITKKSYAVEREITINRPKEDVFNYIKHLRNQEHYSKWVMMDPNMKKECTGTDGNVGFIYAWDGNQKAGKGEQEIKHIAEGKRLDVEIRFERPFAGIASTPFTTEAVSAQQTKLKWGMSSRMKYPMNIMLLFLNMEKLLGKDLQASLQNLKIILEK